MEFDNLLFLFIISLLLAYLFPISTREKYGENFMSKINLMALKKVYGTDLDKASEGVWFDSSMIPGLRFKIAKSGNPEYDKLIRNLYKPYRKALQKGRDLDQTIQDKIMAEVIAKTIVLNWKGMPGEDGNDVLHSVDECMNLMLDPELEDLKAEILEFADDSAKFELELDEATEKN